MISNEWANFGRDTLENIITTGALVGLGSLVAKAANGTLLNNPSKPEHFDFENKSIDENLEKLNEYNKKAEAMKNKEMNNIMDANTI